MEPQSDDQISSIFLVPNSGKCGLLSWSGSQIFNLISKHKSSNLLYICKVDYFRCDLSHFILRTSALVPPSIAVSNSLVIFFIIGDFSNSMLS